MTHLSFTIRTAMTRKKKTTFGGFYTFSNQGKQGFNGSEDKATKHPKAASTKLKGPDIVDEKVGMNDRLQQCLDHVLFKSREA